MGRKSLYDSVVRPRLDDIKEWIGIMNEADIADRLGISVTSFEKYKRENKELADVLVAGKERLVDDLKQTLKKKAKGFEYTETKTIIRQEAGKLIKVIEEYKKYSPPDTGAIHLLLKNLDETWTNDDKETMSLKRAKLELEKLKAEAETW